MFKMKLMYWMLVLTIIELIGDGECIVKDLADIIVQTKPGDVKLHLYTRADVNTPRVEVTLDDPTDFYLNFHKDREMLFTVHGALSDTFSEFSSEVREKALLNYDINFVEVTWPSANEYIYTCAAMVHYGEYLGDFINVLNSDHNYSFDNIRLVGDGLGGHFCGVTGRVTKGQCKYIVGTDPDGTFLYDWEHDDSRQLADQHAQHVQVIHTSTGPGNHGLKKSVGKSDFWPNKGDNQPGCTIPIIDEISHCSHKKAFKYFAESLNNATNGFHAVGYDKDLDIIDDSRRAYMGGFELDPNANGDYFLKTNADEPYALGDSGI